MSENKPVDLVNPPEKVSRKAHVGSMEEYFKQYERSINDPEDFWSEVAENFYWYKKWDQVRSFNYNSENAPIDIKWYEGAKTNVCYNCVDRHLEYRSNKTAIIWEGNEPGEDKTVSYKELHVQVSKFANVLKSRGVKKGDRVSIYMPMVVEATVAMLACARIGAIHSVVFGGFAANELSVRIDDATPKVLIAATCGLEGSKGALPYMPAVNKAIELASHKVPSVVVVQRSATVATMIS